MNNVAEIKYVSRVCDEKITLYVYLENSEGKQHLECAILEELYVRLGSPVGQITEDELSDIVYYSNVTKAYFSACSSFAFTPSSLKGLLRKLTQKGFSREVSQAAIEVVEARGFVDEYDIASRRAELMLEKGWGRAKIIMKLVEEGFGKEIISLVGDSLSDVDFVEICQTVILKKFKGVPNDKREKDKMYASLLRYGYSGSEIRRAILNILDGNNDFSE